MRKGRSLKRKKLMKITSILTIYLVAIFLISNSTISLTLSKISKTNEINIERVDEKISNGLAPHSKSVILKVSDVNSIPFVAPSPIDCQEMFGYRADSEPESIIFFDVCDPGAIEEIAPSQSDDFIACATSTCCNYIFVGCEYGSGKLWEIDHYTGEMTLIGGGGENINSLAIDPTNDKLYGGGDDNFLFEIDIDTGEQDQIGPFGNGVEYMIGMSCDTDGILYGWDLGTDSLWTINKETGEATEIGPLGIDLNYAQDGDFHRDSCQLYLTAYTTKGQLYACDKETGQCTLIGDFEDGAEITASYFLNPCLCTERDIALRTINYPITGSAAPDMKMQVTVKNVGNNTEHFDTHMKIMKIKPERILMEEYFDDEFPPEGWETDFWTHVNTNNSGGNAPEARVYNIDQYTGGQYYDNYIQSCKINCTGFKIINLKFRWAADFEYPQYCSVYVKIRKNSSWPWKDVTPWENPVGENQNGELYDIGCYSFDEPLGEEFQIKWEYIGYYYYFNYLWLDNVTFEGCNSIVEYSEQIDDTILQVGETKKIDFPKWNPDDWQNESCENTWIKYIVNAKVDCSGDQNPGNDEKEKWFELYFPWFHDIGIKSINSPNKNGPGKTYPVNATIKNVGQYDEGCISVNISIGEPLILDTFLSEKNWSNVPPEGWHDEHKDFDPQYGWEKSYTSNSGGSSPEACLSYDKAQEDHYFYSYAIDTSDYYLLSLRFKSYIDHYAEQGLYTLEAGYSTDSENWYTVWHEKPSFSRRYNVEIPILGESVTTYIGFWWKGDPHYFNYWYIDDVELVVMNIDEEYSDTGYIESNISPGEEVIIEFEDWTPEFLQYEITGNKDYIIASSIEIDNDENPANNILTEQFTLEFWHDVGIDEIISPTGGNPYQSYYALWDNGDPDGRYALPGSIYKGYSNLLIDDFECSEAWVIFTGKVHYIWDSGFSSNLQNIYVYIFEETGECNPSLDEYPEEGFFIEAYTFDEYNTGDYYFGRPEVIAEFFLDEPIIIPPGKWYICIQPVGIIDDIAYILTAESKGCMAMVDLPYWGHPRWTSSKNIWGEEFDLAWELNWYWKRGYSPWAKAYIKPGINDIDVIVKNYGTFPKENLTCYAEIWEYITDPENGTKVYSDEISNIDLLVPLGGTEFLEFVDFNFTNEGRYGLFLNLPAIPDDKEGNNQERWSIAVDDTEPISDYPPMLDPPYPDGLNGWYISDVQVTLNANDPWSNSVSSGVKEIRYIINGGSEQVINGSYGSFEIIEDGDDILVEYWAIDWVGNVETPKKSFTIDIDKTVPEVDLAYEVGGNKLQGWKFTFTAIATDVMSGMDRVEFYLNNELQETVTGPGPEYKWTIKYNPLPKAIFKATAYDKAGLFNSDEIIDPRTSSHNYLKYQQIPISNKHILQLPFIR